jgi:LemA protein
MTALNWLAIIVAAVALVAIGTVVFYNALQRARISCDDAWSLIDVMLKRRHDLVPNLVHVVQGYAAHEQQTLLAVTAARSAAIATPDAPAKSTVIAERQLTRSVDSLLAVAERYPELKADAPFLKLQSELADLESQIQASREIYNGNVTAYRDLFQQFPSSLVARAFHFEPRPFFSMDPNVDSSIAPPADFGGPAPEGAH